MIPSEFVLRSIDRIKAGGEVLDMACGSGRHTRPLLERGFSVTALDIDLSGVEDLIGHPRCRLLACDLEDGSTAWHRERTFDGILVTNYLHRPTLPVLPAMLREGGILVYETFMAGNEQYGRPRNPDFLLKESELLLTFESSMTMIAFEQGYTDTPRPSVVQRFCGRRN